MTIMELENGIYEMIIDEKGKYIITLEDEAYRRHLIPVGTISADIYCDIISAVSAYFAGNSYKELIYDELSEEHVAQAISIGQYIQLILMPYNITISKKVVDAINEYYNKNKRYISNIYREVQ